MNHHPAGSTGDLDEVCTQRGGRGMAKKGSAAWTLH
jgi:hypothetical protein